MGDWVARPATIGPSTANSMQETASAQAITLKIVLHEEACDRSGIEKDRGRVRLRRAGLCIGDSKKPGFRRGG